jgi:hypothetical protein
MSPALSPIPKPPATDSILRAQLSLLSERMNEAASETNSLTGKFLFGGVVAVLALLNADLLIGRDAVAEPGIGLAAAVIAIVFALSGAYFFLVARRLQSLRRVRASLGYQEEVTLYALMSGAQGGQYLVHLHDRLDDLASKHAELGRDSTFPEAMAYLHAHHKRGYDSIGWKHDWVMAMTIVLLALVIRIGMYALGAGAVA